MNKNVLMCLHQKVFVESDLSLNELVQTMVDQTMLDYPESEFVFVAPVSDYETGAFLYKLYAEVTAKPVFHVTVVDGFKKKLASGWGDTVEEFMTANGFIIKSEINGNKFVVTKDNRTMVINVDIFQSRKMIITNPQMLN